jgi:hypothetical protein
MLKIWFERQNQHYRRTVRFPEGTDAVEDHVMIEPGWHEPATGPQAGRFHRYFPEEMMPVGQDIAHVLLGRHGIRFLDDNREQEHRIILCESPELPEISRIPWELAALEEQYLLIHRLIPIVRQPHSVKIIKKLTVRQPPRVLMLSAGFTGQSMPLLENQLTTLALTLGELKAHGYVEVEEELNCTREKMNRLLCRNRYDIVCFTGSGYFDESKSTGGLLLETTGGELEQVSAGDLVFYFREQKDLPLVFLNCCNAANTKEGDLDGLQGFRQVARRLMGRGVPELVVTEAAQYEDSARIIIKTFFEELVMDPGFNVAKALTTARCTVDTKPEQLQDFYRFLHYSALEEDAEICLSDSSNIPHHLPDGQSEPDASEEVTGELKEKLPPGYTERAFLLNRGGAFRNLPESLQFDLFRAAGTHPYMINWVVGYLIATPCLPESVTGEGIVLESIRRILPQLSSEQRKKLKALLPEELVGLLKIE